MGVWRNSTNVDINLSTGVEQKGNFLQQLLSGNSGALVSSCGHNSQGGNMAMVKCAECGHSISDKAQVCPQCGAPRAVVPTKAVASTGPFRKAVRWVWYGLVSIAVFSCVYQWNKPREPRAFGEADAHVLCANAIRAASRDPETVVIPFVQATSRGDEISMSWNTASGSLRLKNGLGLEVPASAACVVSRSEKRVTVLSINGQTII
jgi:hypothetical protein